MLILKLSKYIILLCRRKIYCRFTMNRLTEYINFDLLNLCVYKFLCIIVSLKIENISQNKYEKLCIWIILYNVCASAGTYNCRAQISFVCHKTSYLSISHVVDHHPPVFGSWKRRCNESINCLATDHTANPFSLSWPTLLRKNVFTQLHVKKALSFSTVITGIGIASPAGCG